uniref:Uncharacterized protein n=1 Tax=Arabidopsis thaliana TaxID=3702 RepID=Q682G4_ARATH|nr:unnamed protein product [Arabidopsis thaliana]
MHIFICSSYHIIFERILRKAQPNIARMFYDIFDGSFGKQNLQVCIMFNIFSSYYKVLGFSSMRQWIFCKSTNKTLSKGASPSSYTESSGAL